MSLQVQHGRRGCVDTDSCTVLEVCLCHCALFHSPETPSQSSWGILASPVNVPPGANLSDATEPNGALQGSALD